MPSARNILTVNFGDRVIQVYEPTEGQLAIMAHQGRLVRRSPTAPNVLFEAAGIIMAVMNSLIVDEADRDFLADLFIAGDLNVSDLVTLLLPADEGSEVTDAPTQAVIKRPRTQRGQ